jgi:hypothetical protein
LIWGPDENSEVKRPRRSSHSVSLMRESAPLFIVALTTLSCGSTFTCDATTCADGCCSTTTGLCVVPDPSSSGGYCGIGGHECIACGSGATCIAGACRCSSATCQGCCDGQGVCHSGSDLSACGSGGRACAQCRSDGLCQPENTVSVCQAKSCRSHCPNGCCSSDGTCYDGQDDDWNCGYGGEACRACPSGYYCHLGSCR